MDKLEIIAYKMVDLSHRTRRQLEVVDEPGPGQRHGRHGSGHKMFCLTRLTSVLYDVTGRIDTGEKIEDCYADFQKTFDSVKHGLLDQKMKAFRVDAKVKNWIAQTSEEQMSG